MARKLIVEVTTKDDKTRSYECVAFPYVGSPFIVLYLNDFRHENISAETVLAVRHYFKGL